MFHLLRMKLDRNRLEEDNPYRDVATAEDTIKIIKDNEVERPPLRKVQTKHVKRKAERPEVVENITGWSN